MQEISNLPVYTGTIPNKKAQSDTEFANNVFGFLNYSGNAFVGNFNTIIGQFNVLSGEINTAAEQVSQNKEFVSNAKTLVEQTVAVLENGSINDTTPGTNQTYSSNKLDELFSDRYKKEETYSKGEIDTDIKNRLNNHIPLSAFTSYHLLQGEVGIDAYVITKGIETYLYVGNTTTLPSVELDMDIESQWGNDVSETYGFEIRIKARNATGAWTIVNSINGVTKYTDSSSTAVEGTDANMFTLTTTGGKTTVHFGTSTRTNTNGISYEMTVYQTTHRYTGLTNHNTNYTTHVNPITGIGIIDVVCSGNVGLQLPTHLGRKAVYSDIKQAVVTADWLTVADGILGDLKLSGTSGYDSIKRIGFYDNYMEFIASTSINVSAQRIIATYYANSYFDASNKLIGNTELIIFQGMGTTGKLFDTKGKVATCRIKRVDTNGNFYNFSNKRVNLGTEGIVGINGVLYPNLNVIEGILTDDANTYEFYLTFDDNSVSYVIDDATSANPDVNASGGTYIALVTYDTNKSGGGSYYPKPSNNAYIQITNAIIPLAFGIDEIGAGKNKLIKIDNETVTGVTYQEGANYLYKTETGWGVSKHKDRYLKSELTRTYAGESPDYYDIEQNKWFNTNSGDDLVSKGTFDDGTTIGWTAISGATLSVVNGKMQISGGSTAYGSYMPISVIAGYKYKFKHKIQLGTSSGARLVIGTAPSTQDILYDSGSNTTGSYSIEFVAKTTGTYYLNTFNNGTIGATYSIDDVSVFPIEIKPTTEIIESRNYMNRIIWADGQGNPLYVEVLPKTKYENIIKVEEFQGNNACTAFGTFDVNVVPATKKGKSYNFSKVIRTGIGIADYYFETPMDSLNYTADITFNIAGAVSFEPAYTKYLHKITIGTYQSNLVLNNATDINIIVYGGKN